MVKREWLQTYSPESLPKEFELIFQSWDSANKVTELNDYSVCTTWGLKQKKLYLLDVLRRRMDYPDLKRQVREQAALCKAKVILIEDKIVGNRLFLSLVLTHAISSTLAYYSDPGAFLARGCARRPNNINCLKRAFVSRDCPFFEFDVPFRRATIAKRRR